MKISLLSSKKCLTAEATATHFAALLALASLSLGSLASPVSAFAFVTPVAPSQSKLVQEMNSNQEADFEILLQQWTNHYGTEAIQPLLSIAKDKRNSDRQRYIAIMGAAKLGGPAVAEKLVPLLKDKVWLVRNATLRALSALKNPSTAKAVLPLLKDPALVVRAEAVEAVKILKPEGAAPALLSVLQSQDNYRFGKAQWVPQRALAALVVIHDFSIVPSLRPLLDHQKDPELQRQTVFALQTLTGIDKDAKLSLAEQVESWKKILSGDRTPVVTSAAHSEPAPLPKSKQTH
jgi:HEAT repeat protein